MKGSSGLDGRIRNTTLTFLFSGVFGVSLAPAAILDASLLSLALGWLNEF